MRASALAALTAALLTSSAWAQDLAKAQATATQVCAACHLADGNSNAPANPKIAGQFPEYLDKQLRDFKAQGGKKAARESAIMSPLVANLSPGDLQGLAAYYSQQKFRAAGASDKDLAALGQKIWRGGNAANGVPACAGCHGPAGAGLPGQYPRLAGQFAEYTGAQLKLFKEGGRANDPNGVMRAVARGLSEREIRAVAEYAAGLR